MLGNLGFVQRDLGEFEAARASQQRELAIFEAVEAFRLQRNRNAR